VHTDVSGCVQSQKIIEVAAQKNKYGSACNEKGEKESFLLGF
jgi:hypothetical protein